MKLTTFKNLEHHCPSCEDTGKDFYSCCGDDMRGKDSDLCPSCFEHTGWSGKIKDCDDCEECKFYEHPLFESWLEKAYPEVYDACCEKDWTEYEGGDGRLSRSFSLAIFEDCFDADDFENEFRKSITKTQII